MGGYHLLYRLYQQGLKTEMKAYLKKNKTSSFGNRFEFTLIENQVTDTQFSWEEENEEFRYRQELYDVVSIEKKAEKLVIICLKDNEENQLEKQLNQIHQLNKSAPSKSMQNSSKFFSVFYLEKQQKLIIACSIKDNLFSQSSSCLVETFFDIIQPPPRC